MSKPHVVNYRVRAQLAPQIQNALTPLTDGNHPDPLILGVTVRQNLKVSAYARLSVLISTLDPPPNANKSHKRRDEKDEQWANFRFLNFQEEWEWEWDSRKGRRGANVSPSCCSGMSKLPSERETRQNQKIQFQFQSFCSSVNVTVIF